MERYHSMRKRSGKQWGALSNGNKGHSLFLFSSLEEMNRFRNWADEESWSFTMIYEGDREISETVKEFQRDHSPFYVRIIFGKVLMYLAKPLLRYLSHPSIPTE